MATIPGMTQVLTEQYRLRPRETFVAKLSRMDAAGRAELLGQVRQPFVLPSRQESFPSILEARALLRLEQRKDLAGEIEEIRERRAQFQPKPYDDRTTANLLGPADALADLIREACLRAERFSARESVAGLSPLASVLARTDTVFRQDPSKPFRGARRRQTVFADPLVEKSGIQFFTGTQLDVLI